MGRILVIEDEPGAQHLLRGRLRDLGHDVTVKETGAQGIAEAKANSFDLYLIDMHLGDGVDGIEVCRRMKRDPVTRIVPVVLLSGKVRSSADLHRGYDAGCDSFMVKDDMSLVDDVIRAMLRIKSLSDELSTQMGLIQQRNERLQAALRDKAELEDKLARSSSGSSPVYGDSDLPTGVLIVDPEGIVHYADRGTRDIFSKRVEGLNLGNLAPGTRLEAFVRDASTMPRTGFRFSVSARGSRPVQDIVASVLPFAPTMVGERSDMRVVLLHDERRHLIESELLQFAAHGVKLEECADLQEIARREYRVHHFIGNNAVIAELRERAPKLANENEPLLVSGEVGTGKRYLARILHYSSNRTGAFIPVCCGALGRSRIGTELFGDKEHASLLLQATGGTLFLEGVEKLSREVQSRLAEVLESKSILNPKTGKHRNLRVRLVASTLSPVESGDLNPDLFLQFKTIFELPPLRERAEDIPLLAQAFLDRHGTAGAGATFSEDAWAALENYEWPGNLAELNSAVATACSVSGEKMSVDVVSLPPPLPDLHARLIERGEVTPIERLDGPVPGTHQPAPESMPLEAVTEGTRAFLEEVIASLPEESEGENAMSFDFFEKWALVAALARTKGDRLRAAKLLSVGKSTLYRKLHKYELH